MADPPSAGYSESGREQAAWRAGPCRDEMQRMLDGKSPALVYKLVRNQIAMRYHLEIKEEARQQLRALAKEQRRNVGRRLDALQNNLSGDVKKLTAKTHEYRLRVGSLRVL